jgi:RHS repeat-associated protein
VKGTVKDLSGKPLSEQFSKSFLYTGADLLIFQKPDPNQRKESSVGNTTLFQGREYDPETGLYYFRARYYHPELGRFLSEDPLGYKDSFNLSQAFLLNPLNFSDPYGKKNDWDIGPFAKRKEPFKRRPTGLPEPEATKSFYWKKASFWWNQIPSWDIGYFMLPESLNRLKFSSEKERITAGLMLSPLASVFILSGGGGLATGMGIPLEIVNVMEIGGIVSGTTGTMSSLIKKEDPLAGAVVGTGMGMITARAGYFYPKAPEIPVGLVSAVADIASQLAKKGKIEDPLSPLFSGLIGASTPTIKGTLKSLFPKMDEATLEFISKSLSGASKVEQVVITENLKKQLQEQTKQRKDKTERK